MKNHRAIKLGILGGALTGVLLSSSGCATMKNVMAIEDSNKGRQGPIQNPFWDYQGAGANKNENIILRTKKGDRSIEVELPGTHASMTDFVIPMSPNFKGEGGRGPASDNSAMYEGIDPTLDERFREKKPSITDREITNHFPTITPGSESDQREVETGLGLVPGDDTAPAADRSYLAALDHIKQLYKYARYEAALLEIDEMLRAYPTDPKLYQMRGTLLDRVGRPDLAVKSWHQALRLDPNNQSLRRFVDRKETSNSRMPASTERKP